MRRAGLLLILALAACHRERTLRYEALGKQLHSPVAYLCRISRDTKEGGGCNAWCKSRIAADEAHSADQASKLLVAIPSFAEPETEALIEAVRVLARKVDEAIGAICTETVVSYGLMTPEISRCVDAKRGAPIQELLAAVTALGDDAKKRAGVTLPVPRDEWCVLAK